MISTNNRGNLIMVIIVLEYLAKKHYYDTFSNRLELLHFFSILEKVKRSHFSNSQEIKIKFEFHPKIEFEIVTSLALGT